ncbi:MAG: class I SAM-dependent methyltransferase [Bdellovibrionales bacterium]|nr:class I SAM-dependent methyltransferase [Bdellovibrionales bacterium]
MIPNEDVFDRHSATYEKHLNSILTVSGKTNDFFADEKIEQLLRICKAIQLDPKNSSLIDIGCGNGEVTRRVEPLFSKVTGTDLSGTSLEKAQKNCARSHFIHSKENKSIPVSDQSFDVALAFCVLHHIQPQSRNFFMKDIYRLLKPHGILLIYEHNPFNPLTQYIVSRCEFDKDAVLLRRSACENLVESNSFQIVESKFTLILPFKNKKLRHMEHKFLGQLPLGAQYFVAARK